MARALTADDIIPLIAALSRKERTRLLRLIAFSKGADGPLYECEPPSPDEFSADDELLAWDAEGWEHVE
jgi:hypothetical protein